MKRLICALAIVTAGLPVIGQTPKETATPAPVVPADTDVSARSKALELAGAFSNDGYKIRDGFWAGELDAKKAPLLEVNLFAGNEYWFSAAAVSPARKIGITVYDEKGKPVDYQTYDGGAVTASGFAPTVSGRYFLKVNLLEGEKSQFCLLYSYK
ncbi:hypothetical protein BH09VER1_BH09VER1_03360 [soil metagenome]